ncbi:conserved hypothetical protein [Trichophyton verrucosum HKI 0517]|uniref:PI-PLC Y-box domain-containing protein n=1 Tax=Trichophyton verrucosum (strain HKI 0517) TaxID=663202 RepID=D4DGJ7_TRIVH|nr:uncharacterized protein TRV_06301 [Trichophyton verrucosum HKI 0517]EFE39027.1 conserved hypothetical protein [Trichophyton verrucosum HKI 0517]
MVLSTNVLSYTLPVSIIAAYALGIASSIWLFPWAKRIAIYLITQLSADNTRIETNYTAQDESLYGLDHAALNIQLPPTTMWMNMGYWKDNGSVQLPEACEALLDKVLRTAGLDIKSKEGGETAREESNNAKKRVLLDLGFGCGEQTIHLMRNPVRLSPIFDEYIGITLDKVQHGFAQKRLQQKILHENQQEISTRPSKISLFCADAAQPSSWPDEVKKTLYDAFSINDSNNNMERYVMGLDTLYHFHPSRREIFKYSHSILRANLLAFDLFLAPSDPSSLKQIFNTLFLRLLTPALGAPFGNFVSPEAYTTMLEEAGYKTENIVIEDITDHVFVGLAGFLKKRCLDMAIMGLGGYIKWQVAGWLFRWLSSGGILRAGVVIAKVD